MAINIRKTPYCLLTSFVSMEYSNTYACLLNTRFRYATKSHVIEKNLASADRTVTILFCIVLTCTEDSLLFYIVRMLGLNTASFVPPFRSFL
jgi:hypothetical protein